MQRARAMDGERSFVLGCAVALVPPQTIQWVLLVERAHQAITIDFGDYGGGGNRDAQTVSMNNVRLRDFEVEPNSVNQQVVRSGIQAENRGCHCHLARLIDIDPVDRLGIDFFNRDCQRLALDNCGVSLAFGFEQLLGVTQPTDAAAAGQNDSGGYYWTK